jgi:hypothetical protein
VTLITDASDRLRGNRQCMLAFRLQAAHHHLLSGDSAALLFGTRGQNSSRRSETRRSDAVVSGFRRGAIFADLIERGRPLVQFARSASFGATPRTILIVPSRSIPTRATFAPARFAA